MRKTITILFAFLLPSKATACISSPCPEIPFREYAISFLFNGFSLAVMALLIALLCILIEINYIKNAIKETCPNETVKINKSAITINTLLMFLSLHLIDFYMDAAFTPKHEYINIIDLGVSVLSTLCIFFTSYQIKIISLKAYDNKDKRRALLGVTFSFYAIYYILSTIVFYMINDYLISSYPERTWYKDSLYFNYLNDFISNKYLTY